MYFMSHDTSFSFQEATALEDMTMHVFDEGVSNGNMRIANKLAR